jgi:hypothetical protein
MFTTIDKAIIAFLGSLVFLISEFTKLGPDFVSQDMIQTLASILTPILVYFVPEKKKEESADE